jgi:alpha-tubulin suppressor-like RCC1 family protein
VQLSSAQNDYTELLLHSDGTVWGFGDSDNGVLGRDPGKKPYYAAPVRIAGISHVIKVQVDADDGYAVRSDGTVWAWGLTAGIGNGARTPLFHLTPVRVRGLSGIRDITLGANGALALRKDGTVWSWFTAGSGKPAKPIKVKGLPAIKALGDNTFVENYVVARNGTLWTWGFGVHPHNFSDFTPVRVNGVSNVKAVTADQNATTYVLLADGTVRSRGANSSGELGVGNTNTASKTSWHAVVGLSHVTKVVAGEEFALAERTDGTVWGWGDAEFGELAGLAGAGTCQCVATPTRIPGISGAIDISGGRTGWAVA